MTTLDGIVVTGELILLNETERIQFYIQVCKAMGLDPLTRPLQYFEQIDRNGKRVLILYALRSASAQLSLKHKLSSKVTNQNVGFANDLAIFEAVVRDQEGREESAIGTTSLAGLKGKLLADAIMAAQTKSKRRAVLDYAGYALLDESEIEGMNGRAIEVTAEALEGFIPAPAAPQANEKPAVEVFDPIKEMVKAAPLLEPMAAIAAPALIEAKVEFHAPSVPATLPPHSGVTLKVVEPPAPEPVKDEVELKREMDKTVARLSAYRRDVLQRGGMKPSKGFGIQAKWEKFLRKHAPDKSLEQYLTLLTALDILLQQAGETGVVAKVEQEIAG